MIQLIAVAAVGGVAYVAYNSFKKHMEDLKREERIRSDDTKQMPDLEKDPVTGKYRPKRPNNK